MLKENLSVVSSTCKFFAPPVQFQHLCFPHSRSIAPPARELLRRRFALARSGILAPAFRAWHSLQHTNFCTSNLHWFPVYVRNEISKISLFSLLFCTSIPQLPRRMQRQIASRTQTTDARFETFNTRVASSVFFSSSLKLVQSACFHPLPFLLMSLEILFFVFLSAHFRLIPMLGTNSFFVDSSISTRSELHIQLLLQYFRFPLSREFLSSSLKLVCPPAFSHFSAQRRSHAHFQLSASFTPIQQFSYWVSAADHRWTQNQFDKMVRHHLFQTSF